MVKRAQLLEHDTEISDVYSVDVEDFQPSEEQILFDRFKDESQDDLIGIIKVYRIPDSDQITNLYTAKTRYLFNVPVDQFGYEGLLDFIREKYGSGAYRLIGTIPNKSGSRFNKIVEIEAPMKDEPVTVSDSPPRSESPSHMLAAFAAMMKESQERTAELVRSLVVGQTPKDPMEQMGVMMGVMSQMKDFFGGGNKQISLLGELEKYKTISDMFGDSGAETNESDIWVTLAKQFAPAIVEGMTGAAPTAGQQSPVLPAPRPTPLMFDPVTGAPVLATGPVVAPVSEAGVAESGPKKESAEMLNLKNQAAALYASAVKGVLPEKMADTILTLTPDERLDDLYRFMNSESCVQTFIDVYSPLKTYSRWLSQVQVNILDELVQEDFKEPLPGTSPGTEETLHPGELTGADEKLELRAGGVETFDKLTDTKNEDKIEPSAKTDLNLEDQKKAQKKAKSKAKPKVSKKRAAKSPEKDH